MCIGFGCGKSLDDGFDSDVCFTRRAREFAYPFVWLFLCCVDCIYHVYDVFARHFK